MIDHFLQTRQMEPPLIKQQMEQIRQTKQQMEGIKQLFSNKLRVSAKIKALMIK